MSIYKYLRVNTGQYLAAGFERGRLAVRLDASTTGAGIPDPTDLQCPLYPGQERKNTFDWGSDSGFILSPPVGLPAGWNYRVQLNEDAWLPDVAAFNAALSALSKEQRKAGFHFAIEVQLPAGTTLADTTTVVFTATYYET